MLCLYFSYTFQVDSAALPTSAEYLRGLLVRCSPGKLPQAPPPGSTATTVGLSLVVPSPPSSSLVPLLLLPSSALLQIDIPTTALSGRRIC